MRLFVGIDLPKNIKDYLFVLQSKLKDNKLAKVNWISKKKFHITLKFLGEIGENNFGLIKQALSEIKLNSFNLKLNKLGVFPTNPSYKKYISVIWVDVEESKPLLDLMKEIDVKTIKLSNSPMTFEAHFTLGRVKFVKDKKNLLDKLNKTKVEKLEFGVKTFYLFKSTLTKDGPIYDVLEEYKLE